MDPKFDRHFMVICHITLTSDDVSFQGVLFSPCLHKSCLEGPSHWKGTLDVFYARTACHSALAASPFCPFCPSECQTIWHMFVHCPQASSFWNEFQEWYLIILGKYFIYVNALNTIKFQFQDFVSLVREKMKLEKYIAATSDKEKVFNNKWHFFISV